jgi:hypothetical protein
LVIKPWAVRNLIALVVVFVSIPSLAAKPEEEALKVAEAYLAALTGAGDDQGREHLLGGATMNAQLFSLENARIVGKDPVRRETGDLGQAKAAMHELDAAGKEAVSQLAQTGQGSDSLEMTELSQEDAQKMMAPTKEKASRFLKAHPVLAYATRVSKEVYWHPKNPMRALLAKAGDGGKYSIELYQWKVETREGPRQAARVWPLRVLRFKAGKLDTGWKVLPASDWNAE